MKIVDNRTTREDNNKNQTTNIIYDQNSMSMIKIYQNKNKIAADKTKAKPFDLYFLRKEMGPVPIATGQQVDKKEQIGAKFNNFHSY